MADPKLNVSNSLNKIPKPQVPSTTNAATQAQSQFEAAFKANDKDNNKSLDRSEFRMALSDLQKGQGEAGKGQVSESRAEALFDVADGIMGDGDGKVSQAEFAKLGKTLALLEDGKAAVAEKAPEAAAPAGPKGSAPEKGGAEGGAPAKGPEQAGAAPAPGPVGPAGSAGSAEAGGGAMPLDELWRMLLEALGIDTSNMSPEDLKKLMTEGLDMSAHGPMDQLKNKLKAGASEDGKRKIDDLFHKLGRAAGPDQKLSMKELGSVPGAMNELGGLLKGLKEKGEIKDLIPSDMASTAGKLGNSFGGSIDPSVIAALLNGGGLDIAA